MAHRSDTPSPTVAPARATKADCAWSLCRSGPPYAVDLLQHDARDDDEGRLFMIRKGMIDLPVGEHYGLTRIGSPLYLDEPSLVAP